MIFRESLRAEFFPRAIFAAAGENLTLAYSASCVSSPRQYAVSDRSTSPARWSSLAEIDVPNRRWKNERKQVMTDRPLSSLDDDETSLPTQQPLKRTVTNFAIFNGSPTKFASFITHSIDTLSTGVATQNFFAKTVCVRLFNGGIVSISLLPSSTNLMANDHVRARLSRNSSDMYSDVDEPISSVAVATAP